MNGKIRKLLADRHLALSQHQHNKVISIKPKLQCEIRRAKLMYAAKVEQSLKFDNSRQSWDQLKSILSLKKPNSQCHLLLDVLNKCYTRFEKYISPPNISQVIQDDLSPVTVCWRPWNLSTSVKVPADNIPNKLLKTAAHSLSELLRDLFNNCISQGVFPVVWKSSTIIPIPKNAGTNEAKEFCPIALTSTLSKLFERMLLKFLQPYLADTTQLAYQQHRSTEDALAHLLDIVTNHLDINAKDHGRCIFIGLSNEFNTISPTTLCNQLQDTSLNLAVLNRIYDFMTNHPQKVLTRPIICTYHICRNTTRFCNQPFLFSIYVQHMPKPSSGNFHLIKYADDTVFIELLSKNDVLQMDIAAHDLAGWCHDNDLFLNVFKTKELLLCNLRDNPVHNS